MARKRLKNITRIKNMKGRRDEYWVRVQRYGKKIADRHFYDSISGGALKAREAACAFRDEILANNPKMTRQEYARRKMGNNTSGVSGVQQIRRENENGKLEIIAYRTRWIPKKGGKRVSATFTVVEHGLRKARRLAIEARENGIAEMQN